MSDSVLPILTEIKFYVAALGVLAAGYLSSRLWSVQSSIRKVNETLELVSKEISLSPDQITDKHKNTKEKIILQGQLSLSKQAKPIPYKKNNLVMRIQFVEKIYSNDHFEKDAAYQVQLKRLKGRYSAIIGEGISIKGSKQTIIFNNFDKIDFSPALQVLQENNKRRSLSIGEHIQSILLSFIRAVVMVDNKRNDVSFLRGIVVGTRSVTAGMKVGSSVFAIGKIITSPQTQDIMFDVCDIFTNRFAYIIELESLMTSLAEERIKVGGVLALLLIYLGRRAWLYEKTYKLIPRLLQNRKKK